MFNGSSVASVGIQRSDDGSITSFGSGYVGSPRSAPTVAVACDSTTIPVTAAGIPAAGYQSGIVNPFVSSGTTRSSGSTDGSVDSAASAVHRTLTCSGSRIAKSTVRLDTSSPAVSSAIVYTAIITAGGFTPAGAPTEIGNWLRTIPSNAVVLATGN